MKFLLKRRIGISSSIEAIVMLAAVFGSFSSLIFDEVYNSFIISYFPNYPENGDSLLILSSFSVICLFLILISLYLIEIYRTYVPYIQEDFIENGKTYTCKYYPTKNIRKYYYEGKLHRENDAALIYYNKKLNKNIGIWYINGEQIEESQVKIKIQQHKIDAF